MRRIPRLETERLIIRELTLDDLQPINEILNDAFGAIVPLAERKRWLEWTVLGYDMFSALEQPHYGERGIVLKETGKLIGAVGIVPYRESFDRIEALHGPQDAHATAEVGLFWAIAPMHQRRGHAPEAAHAIIDYLFTHEKLGRIIATTGYDNAASQAVMRKLGMTVQSIHPPQPPDLFVVGVLENQSA